MELDFNYIKDFEYKENDYNIFYKKPVNYITINIHFIKNNIIFKTINKIIYLNKSILLSDNLLYIIKNNINSKYKLKNLIYFNFTIDNNDINDLISNNIDINKYITLSHSINNFKFNETISYFSDLNSLDIFLEKKEINNYTKRVYFTNKKTRKNT
jgi:hypothetical protein